MTWELTCGEGNALSLSLLNMLEQVFSKVRASDGTTRFVKCKIYPFPRLLPLPLWSKHVSGHFPLSIFVKIHLLKPQDLENQYLLSGLCLDKNLQEFLIQLTEKITRTRYLYMDMSSASALSCPHREENSMALEGNVSLH